jgi:hypothetical protein
MLTNEQRMMLRRKVSGGRLLSMIEASAAIIDAGIFDGWSVTSNGRALVLQRAVPGLPPMPPGVPAPQWQVTITPDRIAWRGAVPPELLVGAARALWGQGARLDVRSSRHVRRALREAGFTVINQNRSARMARNAAAAITNRANALAASVRRPLAALAPRI